MITNKQIKQMGGEAAQAGDIEMAAICARALDDDYSRYDLDAAERARVDAMTLDEARAECERVIAHARAQEDANMDLAVSETRAHRAGR